MEQLRALIGKKIMNHHLSTDELFFQTECGETIRIFSNELEGWVDFDFDGGLSPMLEERTVHDLEFYPYQIIFHFGGSYEFCVYTEGIKRALGIRKSDDGLELLLEIETIYGARKNIHYFKHENTWRIANFRQTLDNIHIQFAKKYDIINHPSVRIKTLV